jgi:cyclase
MKTRVIPILLLQNQGLVKTENFKKPTYVGDPINTIRIFNEKEVDELVFLDISATPSDREPNFDMVEDIAGEAFMPVAYGGGIRTFDQAARVFGLGIEKVVVNTACFDSPTEVEKMCSVYGQQAVVACIDFRKSMFGNRELSTHSATKKRKVSLDAHLQGLENMGVGEIIVNDVGRDGTQKGYDVELLHAVSSRVSIPVVACGGAGSIADFRSAVIDGGCSAVGAGSMFVFNGKYRAVLVSYPERQELQAALP